MCFKEGLGSVSLSRNLTNKSFGFSAVLGQISSDSLPGSGVREGNAFFYYSLSVYPMWVVT